MSLRDRAGLLAGRRGALDAAGGFDLCGVDIEADVGLVEVLDALFGRLLGHWLDANGESAGNFVCHGEIGTDQRRTGLCVSLPGIP